MENHIGEIENMIHKLAVSKPFLDQFVSEEERHLNNVGKIKRGDVRIGEDVDVSVRHITEHQTFTMILVPISIYSLAIYDTLLFSVIEVSDAWLEREFPYVDYTNDSIKSSLLSLKNHELLANHLYSQAMKQTRAEIGKVKVDLKESYITTNSVTEHVSNLDEEEKRQIRNHWGLLKKAFTHDIELNVEFNIYVFGFNDLEVACSNKRGDFTVKITPTNIFQRHHFVED
ncbi:hypothetical protein N6H18_14095 [Reichenbachiella agarivorans]|uniref:Uncharacterized protein n=1 Tax=Reichenbachiella agarivorans TaxID=2979464 RepID=A0ABY6CN75_9BACT|nr:hypothetical protein [Reichenbachiella agarivorans]UXP31480.1 hypothetical protein N6H18_14095 [Reichenbachiella agarivorans]